jgi:pimeloyl-ACP methyl ester carboxylesterase
MIFGRLAEDYPVGHLSTALKRPATYVGHAREVMCVAQAAARYPLGLLESAITTGQPCGDTTHDRPVVLVHGYGHNRSGWHILNRSLRRAGFTSVHTTNYNPLRHDIPELGRQLARRIEVVRSVTGADRVHVVGHSLGGVLLRWYVEELGGDETVHTAVTVGSPHEGTRAAGIGLGRTARQLEPDSWVMRKLTDDARSSDVRWIAFYSNLDMLIRPSSAAMLRDPVFKATNILAKDHGHVGMMTSGLVVRAITEQLEAAEGAGGLAPLGSIAAAAEVGDSGAGPVGLAAIEPMQGNG